MLDAHQQHAPAAAEAAVTMAPGCRRLAGRSSRGEGERYGAAVGTAFVSTGPLERQFGRMRERGARGVTARLFHR